MGFFQELKEDLSQAVNELVPEEEENEAVEVEDTQVDEFKENIEELVMEDSKEQVVEPVEYNAFEEPVAQMKPSFNEKNEDAIIEAAKNSLSDEMATITSKMKISGDVESDGSLDLIGQVDGNIHILGKLNVTGVINGNSEAAEVYAQGAKITGDVTSLGSVKIANSSVIRGNIYATSAVIAGAVKGDIDVKGPVILDASAIVMGNIKSKAVQINNGAVIEGLCSQCYADVSPSSFFKD